MKLQLTCCLCRLGGTPRVDCLRIAGFTSSIWTQEQPGQVRTKRVAACSQGTTPCCIKHGTQSSLRLGPILLGGSAYTECLHPHALPCSAVQLIQLLVQAKKRGDAQALPNRPTVTGKPPHTTTVLRNTHNQHDHTKSTQRPLQSYSQKANSNRGV